MERVFITLFLQKFDSLVVNKMTIYGSVSRERLYLNSLRHFLIYGGTEGMSGIEKLENDGVIKELRPKVKANILGYKPS